MTQSTTKPMTKLARARRAGAFTALLAIIGVTAVMAGVTTAQAADLQATEASSDDAANQQAAGPGYAVAARPGPYASVRHDRRAVTAPAARKDFQDVK
jgi:hypothetical protein